MAEGKLSEIASTLSELLIWTKLMAMKEVKNVLLAVLDSEAKKIIYSLSDGEKGSVEIAAASDVSDWTVRNYWKTWNKIGIMQSLQSGSGLRYKKAFDLEDFGIEVQKVESAKPKSKKLENKGVT